MNIEGFFAAISDAGRRDRSRYHLTLDDLVAKLATVRCDAPVAFDDGTFPGTFDSYRGYYADLAINPSDEPSTAGALLETAKAALGQTFEGYKGGEFTMGPDTPLWTATYGCCGKAIVGIDATGDRVVLETKEVD